MKQLNSLSSHFPIAFGKVLAKLGNKGKVILEREEKIEVNVSEHKSALMVAPKAFLDHIESGASKRFDTLVSLLRKSNYEVTSVSLSEFRAKFSLPKVELIVFCGIVNASDVRYAKKQGCKVWYDACDSQTRLKMSLIKAGDLGQIPSLIKHFIDYLTLKEVDIVTFISENDAVWEKSLKRAAGKVFIINNLFEINAVNTGKTRRIVFVGDGTYSPNKLAVKFIEQIADALPSEMRITVLGRHLHSNHPKLIIEGYVDKKDLYWREDIHIAPILAGAGIKNKVLEPLLHGLNVVTTPIGASGIKEVSTLYLATTAEEFARLITQINPGNYKGPCADVVNKDEKAMLISFLRGYE